MNKACPPEQKSSITTKVSNDHDDVSQAKMGYDLEDLRDKMVNVEQSDEKLRTPLLALEKNSRRRSKQGELEQVFGKKKAIRGFLWLIGLAMAGAALVALVLGGMKDKAVYSKSIDELVASQPSFMGKQVRAEGTLVHGSLKRRDSPCEYRFDIEKNNVRVHVRYPQCVVPDTFRDVPNIDVGVTVEGQLLADHRFEASHVLAKCPSKYDMQEKQKSGETMPHPEPQNNM